jgi:CHASE2 domain-containing sensor protein/tRNA A-37 threonylcarbamoyl transferase component Bud32
MKKIQIKTPDLLIGLIAAGIFIFFSLNVSRVFESIERVFYGIEMRLDLPQSLGENRIAIVNIDEKSLKQLGPWPWPRSVIASMITILKSNGATLIGLDLNFNEKENNQGLREIRELHQAILKKDEPFSKDPWLLETLRDIENRLDNDTVLARAIKESGNIILPIVGSFGKYDTEMVLTEGSFLKKNALEIRGNSEDFVSADRLATPFPELSENCRGLGHINLSPNKLTEGQVHLLFINYRGHVIPSMPLLLAVDYSGKRLEEVLIQGKGIQLSKTVIPTMKGEIFVKFKGGRRSFPYYSFVDILNVKKVPAVFEDKIVLIGYTAEGASTIKTPVDLEMPQVEWTANVVENLMLGRYLKRPNAMLFVEVLIILILSLLTAMILPRFTFLNRLGVTVGILFLVFLSSFIAFKGMNIWMKTTYIGLALVTVYAALSIKDIIIREKSIGLTSKESIETNRMLGLSFQSQGLLDLAFEKFRKCPLDDAMKDVVYNLGLDYERKRMINKAVAVYEYITQTDKSFKGLSERIPKLKKLISPLARGSYEGKKEAKILVSDDLDTKPTIGRYEILSELGQGAMGVVYKAQDPKINRLVAIKTIRFSDEFEDEKIKEVKDRFLREAEIAGQLSHPTIVSIYDVGEDYDLTYLAMEYLEGDDLHKYCKKGSLLPLRRVLFIISETANALDYSHKQGVIHRDIKPANVMLLKDGKVKVTDFGIAKAVSSSQTKSGIILGTPNYMSPEQINGHKIDGRSDIFSLGVVFFELLTGQLPFHGKSLTNLFYQITQAKHPSPRSINPKVPKPCEQIIDKALAKDPEQRFQKAGDFAKYVRAMITKIDQVRARAR